MELEELLEKHEGRKNKVYKCTAGKRTIGVGHNIDAKGLPEDIQKWLDMHGWITEDMIDDLLQSDIEDALNDAWKLYPALESFSESRRNALIDFLFNVGLSTASTFKRMNNAINNGNWDKAAQYISESKYWRQLGGDPKGTDDGKLERPEEIAQMLREG